MIAAGCGATRHLAGSTGARLSGSAHRPGSRFASPTSGTTESSVPSTSSPLKDLCDRARIAADEVDLRGLSELRKEATSARSDVRPLLERIARESEGIIDRFISTARTAILPESGSRTRTRVVNNLVEHRRAIAHLVAQVERVASVERRAWQGWYVQLREGQHVCVGLGLISPARRRL
jgi:hypothetical protein